MTHHVVTEDELRQFEANVKKIKQVGGGVAKTTMILAKCKDGGGVARKEMSVSDANMPLKKRVSVVTGGAIPPAEKRPRIDRCEEYAQAGSNPASPPYKSKWDAAYASKLDLEQRAGMIKAYWYEPFSLWLPGKVRYKPDFLIQYPDGLEQRLEIIEVKGWSKNRRDGMTRLKIAAAIYNCFVWRLVYRTKGGGWDGEYM